MEYARNGWAVEAGMKKGRPVPDWYKNKPDKKMGQELWMMAFWDLDTCRIFSDGQVGPIPWDKIHAYAGYLQLDSYMAFVFTTVIRFLDNSYLTYRRDHPPT